jgi:uroporphyrinogen decarboxylase
MWKEFSWPYLRRMVDAAHEAGALCMLHSCGYQMPLLPYYAEAGIDLLQSFQPKAGNDLAQALREYGDRLGFVTGIDIQRGESMRPDELRDEILANWRIGRGKRFILGTTHEIQYTMPLANVGAILATAREIRAGQHGD